MIGPLKASSIPMAPKQKQHATTITTMTMTHGSSFFGCGAGMVGGTLMF
jgi:hypothetical protein